MVPGRAAGNHQLVEAGGQRFRSFRSGLDYAFIPSAHASEWMRSVLSRCVSQLDPSARPGLIAHGESMSLYRAGLKLALFLPLGVAMPPLRRAPSGFADVSSVFSQSSRIGATLDRTPVRKP